MLGHLPTLESDRKRVGGPELGYGRGDGFRGRFPNLCAEPFGLVEVHVGRCDQGGPGLSSESRGGDRIARWPPVTATRPRRPTGFRRSTGTLIGLISRGGGPGTATQRKSRSPTHTRGTRRTLGGAAERTRTQRSEARSERLRSPGGRTVTDPSDPLPRYRGLTMTPAPLSQGGPEHRPLRGSLDRVLDRPQLVAGPTNALRGRGSLESSGRVHCPTHRSRYQQSGNHPHRRAPPRTKCDSVAVATSTG